MDGTSVRDTLAEKRKRLQDMRANRDRTRPGLTAPGSPSPGRVTASPPADVPADAGSTSSQSPTGAKRPTSDILSKVSPATSKEATRLIPKPPTLTLVKPEKLTWSIAPSGKADNYTKEAQTVHSGPIEKATETQPGSPSPTRSRSNLALLGAGNASGTAAVAGPAKSPEKDDDEIEEPDALTDGERVAIVRSRGFQEFFKSASFIVERALCDKDILPPGMADSSETVLVRGQGDPLVRTQLFNDSHLTKKITKGCPVTSVDFCTSSVSSQEMFLASYFKRLEGQTTLEDIEGQVLVWSIRVPQRPFQTLTAPSDVAKAMYCKFKPNIIVGGLYNGQVCLWDTRVGSEPQQLTPLTMDGHTHPVFGMDVVGSVNSHSLVSLSSDGKVCAWQMEKMNTPVETHTLQQMVDVGGTAVAKEIQATSLAFRDNESNKFYLGSENGMLLSGTRSSGMPNPDGYEGHTSPITSLHCHPANPGSTEDYTDLVLTSSMDWTCKLWQPSKSNTPLFSFDEYTDYVYDAKWSPVHPAVFASVDGSGTLSVWNLIESMETPIGKVEAVSSGKASCHLAWSGDGKSIIVGDAGGDVTLWEVAGSESSPKAADWPLLGQKLSEINAV